MGEKSARWASLEWGPIPCTKNTKGDVSLVRYCMDGFLTNDRNESLPCALLEVDITHAGEFNRNLHQSWDAHGLFFKSENGRRIGHWNLCGERTQQHLGWMRLLQSA